MRLCSKLNLPTICTLFAVLYLVPCGHAKASCPCYQTTPTRHIAQSQWIFNGQVISIRRVSNDLIQGYAGRSEWSVRVRRHLSLKGRPPLEVDLLMLSDECELNPRKMIYRRLTFFAQPNPAGPYFHYCDVAEVLKSRGELGPGPMTRPPDYYKLLPGLSNISTLQINNR